MLKEEIKQILYNAIEQWIEREGLGIEKIPPFSVDPPPLNIPGDLSCNIAMLLAKKLRINPQGVAQKILSNIGPSSICSKIEIAGGGFINFFISPARLYKELETICNQEMVYGKRNLGKQEKVHLEFVSANPTGPLHIGHGRGAAIGDALANILRFVGYDVTKEYYVNDRGSQIETLGCSVMLQYDKISGQQLGQKERKYLEEKKSEDLYKGKYIEEIAREIFNDKKYINIRERQDARHWFFEKEAVERILKWIKEDLKYFGVEFNNWFNESRMYECKEVDEVIKILQEKDYIDDRDKARWFKSSIFGDEKDRVVVRKNGEKTYLASDIAYHYDKFRRGFKKIINIWGADHHGYVPRLKGVISALGYNSNNLKVILYQLVRLYRGGKLIPMSTRKGEFITLREVLDEVGPDVCRFFFLMRGAGSLLDFDLEIAKKQSPENPVYYIQYAHARICSVFKEAEKRNYLREKTHPPFELLKNPQELEIIKKLAFYPDVIHRCVVRLEPHHIVSYLQDLAKEFHSYYNECRILSDDIPLSQARLKLVEGVKIIVRSGLSLLGVSIPERM